MFVPPVAKPKSVPPQRLSVAPQLLGVSSEKASEYKTEENATRISKGQAAASWDFSKISVFSAGPEERMQSPPFSPTPSLPTPIQANLKVGARSNPSQQREADRVAVQVMRTTAPEGTIVVEPSHMSRNHAAREGKERKHQKKTARRRVRGELSGIVSEALRSPGQHLDPETRGFMESRFRHDFSQVRIHTDANAARATDALGARAYTLGADIVFGQREYLPTSEQHLALLAHELVHVLQRQNSGNSIQAMTEIGSPADSAEQEAENVARSVLETDPTSQWHPELRLPSPLVIQSCAHPVLRRFAKKSWAGEFRVKDDAYKVGYDDEDPKMQQVHPYAKIEIDFEPNQNVEAAKIAFVQTSNTTVNGQPHPLNTTVASRSLDVGELGEGTHIDASHTSRTPLAGMKTPSSGNDLSQSQESHFASYGSGKRDKKKYISKVAQIADQPAIPVGVQDEAEMYFESSPMAVEGVQEGVYYGAIKWGWSKKKGTKKPEKIELALISQDAPSSSVFQKLGTLWDAAKTSTGESAIHLPTVTSMYTAKKAKLVDDPAKPKKGVDLDADTHVEVTERTDPAHKDWRHVIVIEGPEPSVGKMGWLMEGDLTGQKPILKKKGSRAK